MKAENNNKDSWAIGGGILAGVGYGFFYIQTAPLVFVGSIIIGLGIGLIITAILAAWRKA